MGQSVVMLGRSPRIKNKLSLELRIIRKLNKSLNCLSVITLLFGIISIVWTAQNASNLWAIFTLSTVALGLLSLLISWASIKWRTVKINDSEIVMLTINSRLSINEIKDHNEIDYLGNIVSLRNGTNYEIDRTQILELIKQLDSKSKQVKRTKQKFYNISPKELIKGVLELGA